MTLLVASVPTRGRASALGGNADRELVMAVRAVAVRVWQAEELNAHHELLLAPRTGHVLKVSHVQLRLFRADAPNARLSS